MAVKSVKLAAEIRLDDDTAVKIVLQRKLKNK